MNFRLAVGFAMPILVAACSSSLPPNSGAHGAAPIVQSPACNQDFGSSAPALALKWRLRTREAVAIGSVNIDEELKHVCVQMLEALGDSAGAGDTAAVCQRTVQKLNAELAYLRDEAHLAIAIYVAGGVCHEDMDAYRICAHECDPNFGGAGTRMTCSGVLVGGCRGVCDGRCAMEVHGRCDGIVSYGICTEGCSGIARGDCDGTCGSPGPNGRCDGACAGTFYGGCLGGCAGFEGMCEVTERPGPCAGECHGRCLGVSVNPDCMGQIRSRGMREDCRISCDSIAAAQNRCREAFTHVRIEGRVPDALRERVRRARDAIERYYPHLADLKSRLRRLDLASPFISPNAPWTDPVRQLGEDAITCSDATNGELRQLGLVVAAQLAVASLFPMHEGWR